MYLASVPNCHIHTEGGLWLAVVYWQLLDVSSTPAISIKENHLMCSTALGIASQLPGIPVFFQAVWSLLNCLCVCRALQRCWLVQVYWGCLWHSLSGEEIPMDSKKAVNYWTLARSKMNYGYIYIYTFNFSVYLPKLLNYVPFITCQQQITMARIWLFWCLAFRQNLATPWNPTTQNVAIVSAISYQYKCHPQILLAWRRTACTLYVYVETNL